MAEQGTVSERAQDRILYKQKHVLKPQKRTGKRKGMSSPGSLDYANENTSIECHYFNNEYSTILT